MVASPLASGPAHGQYIDGAVPADCGWRARCRLAAEDDVWQDRPAQAAVQRLTGLAHELEVVPAVLALAGPGLSARQHGDLGCSSLAQLRQNLQARNWRRSWTTTLARLNALPG